jgi:hypothetical protein
MINSKMHHKKIRFGLLPGLIFLLLASCSGKKENNAPLAIQWENKKAAGIIIPPRLMSAIPVIVFLKGHIQPVLGKNVITGDSAVFRPLIPFTRGLTYEVYAHDELISEIEIPPVEQDMLPIVEAIYPAADTLPENLLKIHIAFNRPMQEGQSLEHVVLVKNDHDTLPAVFLDLQPELWNNDRTILTLWLDPGRIKRDLQPNIKMGPPLQAGTHYQLNILQGWRDADGSSLRIPFQKKFVTTGRDERSPQLNSWSVNAPGPGSKKFEVDFHEPLDYVLIKHAIFIVDTAGHEVKGIMEIKKGETGFSFTPSSPWKKGTYTIECEGRLEDLAGNNLNRLFDKDLTQKETEEPKEIYRRSFQVR